MGNTLARVEAEVSVANIVNYGEQVVLPEGMSLDSAIDLLQRRQQYLMKTTFISETYQAFPLDGANALHEVLTEKYGWAQGIPTPGFFGEKPPRMLTIEVGYQRKKQVPWGRLALPNVEGYVECGHTTRNGRCVFLLGAKILRRDESKVRDLFDAVGEYLNHHSIYQGHAIKLRFYNDDGQALEMPEPEFMRTDDITREDLVYSRDVQDAIETNLFTPIERLQDCIDNGITAKRSVLFAGPFGTGKTLGAKVAATIAVQNGLTFLYASRANELSEIVNFAKLYQHPACVIFCEDIDRATSGERSVAMDDLLNIIDGIDSKSCNIITVLTTNNLEAINQAMLRPGRLDAVIEIMPPDAEACERLIRLYGGEAIPPAADLTAVGKELNGTIPAVIAEVVKRAKLAQLKLQATGEPVTVLTEQALLESARSMKMQIGLLAERDAPEQPTMDRAMQECIERTFNGSLDKIDKIHTRLFS